MVEYEYSIKKRMWSTTWGTCGREGCLVTTRSSFIGKARGPTRIPGSTDALTRLLSAYDPKGIPSLHELLVCQTQAKTQTGQGKYPVPPTTAFTQPSEQPWVKLSKLVKKARQLGCKTFSSSIDAIVAKNWLKKVSNTLTDLKLDDDLKLRVATRLIDKSAAT